MAFMIKQAHLEETPLNISDLTTTHLTGNGVFDAGTDIIVEVTGYTGTILAADIIA